MFILKMLANCSDLTLFFNILKKQYSFLLKFQRTDSIKNFMTLLLHVLQ